MRDNKNCEKVPFNDMSYSKIEGNIQNTLDSLDSKSIFHINSVNKYSISWDELNKESQREIQPNGRNINDLAKEDFNIFSKQNEKKKDILEVKVTINHQNEINEHERSYQKIYKKKKNMKSQKRNTKPRTSSRPKSHCKSVQTSSPGHSIPRTVLKPQFPISKNIHWQSSLLTSVMSRKNSEFWKFNPENHRKQMDLSLKLNQIQAWDSNKISLNSGRIVRNKGTRSQTYRKDDLSDTKKQKAVPVRRQESKYLTF